MLLEQIQKDYTEALKNRQELKVSVLRMLVSEIKNKEIELRGASKPLTEADMFSVLNKELKKRRESAEIFGANNRPELAETERQEAQIIEGYLPKQLSSDELEFEVKKIVDGSAVKEFASVIKTAMQALKDKADGRAISEAVKRALGS